MSTRFLPDALSLEVRNDVLADGFRWVTAGTPGQDVAVVRAQGLSRGYRRCGNGS